MEFYIHLPFHEDPTLIVIDLSLPTNEELEKLDAAAEEGGDEGEDEDE